MPFRHRRSSSNKPPKPVKLSRPSTTPLRNAYKELLSGEQRQRLDAFLKVLNWYSNSGLPYILQKVGGKLDLDKAKKLEQASKMWDRGRSTDFMGEKETSYRMACKFYQKVADGILKVPKIDPWLSLLDQRQPGMEARQARLQVKIGKVLELLMSALKPVDANGQPIKLVVGVITDPVKSDPDSARISFRRDVVIKLYKTFRREGLFPIVLQVLDPISRMVAIEKEIDAASAAWTGKWIVRPSKQKEAMEKLLSNLVAFGKTPEAPKRWVRVPLAALTTSAGSSTGQPRAPRPRPAGFGGGGNKVDGLFTAGSDRCVVYEFLKDGKEHEFSDIHSACPKSNLKGILAAIAEKGMASSKYRIEQSGTKFKMVSS